MTDHTCARHEPDRRCYAVCGCRCDTCRIEHQEYNRERDRRIAQGRWQPYVDAEPVRDHVRWLQSCGLGWKHIARRAGLAESTVWKLVYGDPTRHMPPSRRVRPDTADALYAVRPRDVLPGARVDAGPARAQLHALRQAGWTWRALGQRLDRSPSNICKVLHQRHVTAALAKAVRDLYRREPVPPPDAVRQPGGHAKAKAEREGVSAA